MIRLYMTIRKKGFDCGTLDFCLFFLGVAVDLDIRDELSMKFVERRQMGIGQLIKGMLCGTRGTLNNI